MSGQRRLERCDRGVSPLSERRQLSLACISGNVSVRKKCLLEDDLPNEADSGVTYVFVRIVAQVVRHAAFRRVEDVKKREPECNCPVGRGHVAWRNPRLTRKLVRVEAGRLRDF